MKRIGGYLVFLFFLAVINVWFSAMLYQQGVAWQLSAVRAEDESFRRLSLSERQLSLLLDMYRNSDMKPGELLTILKSDASGSIQTSGESAGIPFAREARDNSNERKGRAESFAKWKLFMLRYAPQDFERVSGYYAAVMDDVACFPVAADGIVYENSWMFERNYGGKRGHEGTDLMPLQNLRGYYPVVSMTDGIVEKVGWLPLGGYRIGIRSPSGGYFYYAHLDSYSRNFRVGESVSAGTVIGRMGDSGYGPEGTRGKFDVHLHLGIYIRTGNTEELSVNPYWVLRFIQDARTFQGTLP